MDNLPKYEDEYTEGDEFFETPHTYSISDKEVTLIYVEGESKLEVLEEVESHISNLLAHLLTSLEIVRDAQYEIKKRKPD